MRLLSLLMMLGMSVVVAFGHTTYTGYSGAPGRSTCASSCHGSGTGTITVSGFPTSYTPGQAYTVTVSRTGTTAIANFNASCRVGTGSTNAGTIAAGTATSTYNATGETNGVHFTAGQQALGTFSWTAPVAGTGTVRLYLGGHQGTTPDDPNNAFVLVATEAVPPPGAATNPSPADNAIGVAMSPALSWTAGAGAVSHDVYFGNSNPPAFIGNQAGTAYSPGMLNGGATYFWRIDEQGPGGTTAGAVWQFTTMVTGLMPPQNLVILQDQPLVRLFWNPAPISTTYIVYRGTSYGSAMSAIGFTADTSFVDSSGLASPDLKAFYSVTASTP
ncbi:MAG TPA: hypothetical protein VGL38_14325 [bacterium]